MVTPLRGYTVGAGGIPALNLLSVIICRHHPRGEGGNKPRPYRVAIFKIFRIRVRNSFVTVVSLEECRDINSVETG